MQLDVKVVPGAAAVIRYGSVIAVTTMTGGERLVDLREMVRAAAESDDPAAVLFQCLEDGDPLVPVAAVVPTLDGADAVLLGDLEVRAETMVGITQLNGRAAAGAIQQNVPGPLTRISVGDAGNEIPDGFGLEAGVVPGGGAVIVISPSAPTEEATAVLTSQTLPSIVAARPAELSNAPEPEAPAEPEPSFESVPLGGGAAPAPAATQSRSPLPLVSREQVALPAEPQPGPDLAHPKVRGVKCNLGHFNHPNAVNCAWCGRGMLQVSRVTVEGPRPPLGVLVVDEQATFTLDADYVIGRLPSRSPDVDGERVRELVLADPDRLVSRVHAKVILRDWDVTVEDGGSDNGTFVLAGNLRTPPQRLAPNQPRVLRPGDQIHIGRHRLTFHSHHLL